MSDQALREKIVAFMWERGECPTWWFRHHVGAETRPVRRELERMEIDGLVTSCTDKPTTQSGS